MRAGVTLLPWLFYWVLVFLMFMTFVYFGIAGLAPLASYSFATAQKSNQKRPPRQLRPCKRNRGAHLAGIVIMLCQNSQKTLRHAGTEGP